MPSAAGYDPEQDLNRQWQGRSPKQVASQQLGSYVSLVLATFGIVVTAVFLLIEQVQRNGMVWSLG